MHVAHIVPVSQLDQPDLGTFHLSLSHLLDMDEYATAYRNFARRGDWVILDNSAHENQVGNNPELLLHQARELGAKELVLPDSLFDAQDTLRRTREALAVYTEFSDGSLPQFMIVPQGTTIYEWGYCLHELVQSLLQTLGEVRFTLGVSKDYEMWVGGLDTLFRRFILPMHNDLVLNPLMEVHLLGWGREQSALTSLAHRYPWIRSTDSAKPTVYAMNNIPLKLSKESPSYPGRPKDFFWSELNPGQIELAKQNRRIFETRANPSGVFVPGRSGG